MLKPDWIGRPSKWICTIGGWNSLPSQGWRTHRNLLRKSVPPFQFQQLKARSSLGQGYTAPPAPRCLTWSVFLPDKLSYQDMQQQPFLLTVAYAWGLQYWAERLKLPTDLHFCPLVRSVLELKERMKEYMLSFPNKMLSRAWEGLTQELQASGPNPPQLTLEALESDSAGVWETCVTTSSSFGSLPERGDTTVPSTRLQMEDQPIGQDASLIKATTQTASATTSGVELTSPIVPPDWTEEEKWYVLVVTTLVRSFNLEMTSVVLGDTVTASAGEGAFQNPHMAAVLSGTHSSKRGDQQPRHHHEGAREEWCRVRTP